MYKKRKKMRASKFIVRGHRGLCRSWAITIKRRLGHRRSCTLPRKSDRISKNNKRSDFTAKLENRHDLNQTRIAQNSKKDLENGNGIQNRIKTHMTAQQ